MKPLVSILIPAYNAERWIAETIQSALRQTWPRKEIIVIDDGSTDQTLPITREFASKELLVVTQPNQGGSAARNHAFSLSQGEYIQWLDADDLLAPDKIALQMEVADECASKRTLLSSAWGYFLYRPHRASFNRSPLWADLSPLEWLVRKWENNAHMNPATWLVTRELTEAAGPWDPRLISRRGWRVLQPCDRRERWNPFCAGRQSILSLSRFQRQLHWEIQQENRVCLSRYAIGDDSRSFTGRQRKNAGGMCEVSSNVVASFLPRQA